MAFPTYVLVSPDPDLPASRTIKSDAVTSNIQLNDGGNEGELTIETILNLQSLASVSALGLTTYVGGNTFASRAITSSNTIDVTDGLGTSGNINLEVIDNTSLQRVDIAIDGVSTTQPHSIINFIQGNGIGISASDGVNVTNVTIDATVGIGTVTSVGLDSTTGLAITGSPVTTSGTIHVNLPTGTANQVLTIASVSPQVLTWTTPIGGGGTVTSIGIASTSGLSISGSPVTGSGVIDINLPTGTAGQILAINTTGPQTLHWITPPAGSVTSVGVASTTGLTVTGSPITSSGVIDVNLPTLNAAPNKVLAIDTIGPQTLKWIDVGTVTSVGATSTSGITITGSPITGSGSFTIDLPTGTAGEVLSIASTGPQVLQWITPPSGSVTSVGLSSTSGLTIGSTPVTSSGTITVDLPSGTAGQVLAVNTTGPQTLHFITPNAGTVTSVNATSTSGISITGGPITGSGSLAINLPTGTSGQVLSITGTGPQTLGWITPGAGTGTVTSVGVSSTTGLTIGSTPVTTSGTITVNLPTGTTGQVLRIASTGPQVLQWATPTTGTVTSVGLTNTSGLTITGSPITSSGSFTLDLPAGGTANQVLRIVSTGPQVLGWVTPGTVTSVAASSTSGLTIGGSPITSSGTITIDLPTGSLNQVLKITSVSPQVIGWATPTSGTVTSVGLSTTSGLTITGSPVTGSGTITVDLPAGGTTNQVLTISSTGPQVLGWTTPSSSLVVESNNVLAVGGTVTIPSGTPTNPSLLFGKTIGTTGMTGGFNVLMAIDAFTSTVTGSNNTGVGYRALKPLTSGGSNAAFGYQALSTVNSGFFNTAVGGFALPLSSGGSNNTAIGYSALFTATGGSNTAVGYSCMNALTTGSSNTAVGINAFILATNATLTTAIGREAGALRTTYTNCTFVGYQADAGANSLTNATAIGATATVTTSNSLVLGGIGNTNGVNVGIGTASPTSGLHLGAAATNFKPQIYFTSETIPSSPANANDCILMVNTGSMVLLSGTPEQTGFLTRLNSAGSAATVGSVTLNGTTNVTVTTTAALTGSFIMLTRTTSGSGTVGTASISGITNGVSFTIVSSSASDLRGCTWWIIS